jgi:hypothetical protein
MAHPSSISQKTRQAQPLSAILILTLGNQVNLCGLLAREALAAPGDLDGENVVRPVDEVAADHATPFGSSPQIGPISRKFQRTARGSIALVADGMHMSTRALAYTHACVNRSIAVC